MFVRLCADDFRELKFGTITIELMLRLALILFQYWLTNGVNDTTPEEFDVLYAKAKW